jgi:hypothetical protein
VERRPGERREPFGYEMPGKRALGWPTMMSSCGLTHGFLMIFLSGTSGHAQPPPDRFVFETVSREETLGDCAPEPYECPYVRLEYPVVLDAPEGYAADAVSDAVFSLLDPEVAEKVEPRSVDSLMRVFVDDFRDFETESPDMAPAWHLERQVSVVHDSSGLLSLRLFWRAFAGGAHGMSMTEFRSLDPRTGEPIGLSDILVEGHEDTLLSLVEARFRQTHGLEGDASLAEAGFVFEDDTFALPENVRIDGEGLGFYYNLYEVAPYAFGVTEVTLTWEELVGLVKDGVEEAIEAPPGPGEER